MAEQKKLPSLDEALRLKELIAKSGDKPQMDRANQIVLNIKKQQDADSLVKSTGVTGAGGKELFKITTPGDQTYEVNLGAKEVINTKEPIKTITGVTQKIDDTPIKVGTKDIYGRGVKFAEKSVTEGAEGLAKTVVDKAGKFFKRGRVAGVGAFMAGLASALQGKDASAGEMAMGAADALAPVGVSEALQSDSLGPSLKSTDASQRAMAKLEGGDQDKITPEEQKALDEMRAESRSQMQKYRVK